MHGSCNDIMVFLLTMMLHMMFLLTIPSTRRKSAGSLINKLFYSCSASDAPYMYKSVESKSLSLMYGSCNNFMVL